MKRLFVALMTLASLTMISCKNENFDEPPHNTPDPNLPTISIAALRDSFPGGVPYTISGDVTVKGIVVADDRSGNLYQQIVIDDGTAGITVLIDRSDLYTDYPVGRLIYVKCQGLVLGEYHNFLQLGGFVDNSSGQPAVGNIPEALITSHIVKGPTGNTVTPITVDINDLDDSYQSRLVKLEGVEFTTSDANKPWADIVNQQSLSRIIKNCSNDQVEVRTSNFSKFANKNTPKGNGSIIGVYSVYNSDPQLTIRDTTDVDMMGIKCDGSDPNAIDLIYQDFESASTSGNLSLSGWQNIAQTGTKYYTAATFSGNKFGKVSAFSSGEASNIIWLITPAVNLDGTTNENLTFRTLDGFVRSGTTLEALISTNYSGSGDPTVATWTTLPATIASGGPGSGYSANWTSSGAVDISAYSGNVYIAFRYTGSGTGNLTTTFELDDIRVTGQ